MTIATLTNISINAKIPLLIIKNTMPETDIKLNLRKTVDPDERLPNVDLVINPKKPKAKGTLVPAEYLIMSGGQRVGELTLAEDKKSKEAWLNGVQVDEGLRGRGFGTAAYLAAIEKAHAAEEIFRTHDWSQTEDAVKVWKRFIDAGIAEVVEPFRPYQSTDGKSQHFTGHVRIPPTSTS